MPAGIGLTLSPVPIAGKVLEIAAISSDSAGIAAAFSARNTGGESGIVFPPISEITATMEKSLYPFAIADTVKIAAMKFDGG
jgi:hypothetical protein